MDCHDGPDGQPIITHHYTVTTVISFEEALIAVKQYAFKLTEYIIIFLFLFYFLSNNSFNN